VKVNSRNNQERRPASVIMTYLACEGTAEAKIVMITGGRNPVIAALPLT
jgi:hypothetical protein